jgi:hypothetical protein
MRNLRRASWVVILLFILVIAPHGALAQTGGVKTFTNGITLTGEWLAAWSASPDPYTEYGIPITGVIKSATGEQVLYTQQVRFRETPDGIVLDPLGSMLYTPGTPANFSFNTGACRVYGDTGFHICYAFLQAYGIHGSMLGAPLSDPEVMSGRIVQAFEYGWLEWRPENPPNQRVTFMDLGQIAYRLWEHEEPPGGYAPNKPDETPEVPMVAFAFVESSILPAGMDQTLYVIARTPDFKAVEGAIVQIAVEYPDGRKMGLLAERTDADGIARFTFPVKALENGAVVQVQANLQLNKSSAQAGTTFRIWH